MRRRATPGASMRMSWARLLKRVFDIDIERCPQCGGKLKMIAAIEEPAVIERILTHLGLSAQPPPRTLAGKTAGRERVFTRLTVR